MKAQLDTERARERERTNESNDRAKATQIVQIFWPIELQQSSDVVRNENFLCSSHDFFVESFKQVLER